MIYTHVIYHYKSWTKFSQILLSRTTARWLIDWLFDEYINWIWKKPSFDLREFMLNRSRIMCIFSCNKRHILWFFCIQDFAWFPQKSTIQVFNFLKKYCFRIPKYENYDHGQVSIHTGMHKHHIDTKLSTFFYILIRIFKIKIKSMNKWSLFSI